MNLSIFDMAYFMALIGISVAILGDFLGISLLRIIGTLLVIACMLLVWYVYHTHGIKIVDGKFYANFKRRGSEERG